MEKNSKMGILGFVAGAAIGALAGILLAPKSGKETRKDIERRAKKAKKDLAKMVEKARGEAASAVENAGEKVSNKTKSAAEAIRTSAN